MPLETELKCENCGNTILIHGRTMGRLNANHVNVGGPGQTPQTMGVQWAVYECLNCGGVFPYKKYYGVMGRPLQEAYVQIHNWCRERLGRRSVEKEAAEKLKGMIDSTKTLASLPGSDGLEEALTAALEPILKRLDKLETEAKRKRGGRPKKKPADNDKGS